MSWKISTGSSMLTIKLRSWPLYRVRDGDVFELIVLLHQVRGLLGKDYSFFPRRVSISGSINRTSAHIPKLDRSIVRLLILESREMLSPVSSIIAVITNQACHQKFIMLSLKWLKWLGLLGNYDETKMRYRACIAFTYNCIEIQ